MVRTTGFNSFLFWREIPPLGEGYLTTLLLGRADLAEPSDQSLGKRGPDLGEVMVATEHGVGQMAGSRPLELVHERLEMDIGRGDRISVPSQQEHSSVLQRWYRTGKLPIGR